MVHLSRKYLRFVLMALAFTGWMWWDLTQAHNSGMTPYQSFFPATQAAAKSPVSAKVSIVSSNDPSLADPCPVNDEAITYATISQMVRRAVQLAGGLDGIIRTGDTVLIKPNLVQADSSGSGGVTDVRVVKAVVFLVDEVDHGRITILVGDGSPRPFTTFEKATGTTQKAWKGLFDVPGYQLLKAEALGAGVDFHLTNLNGNSDTDPWPELDTVSIPGGGMAEPQGGTYFVHRDVLHADVYITVPVLKIHKDMGFTCALKNQIGIAPSTRYGFNKTTGVIQENRIHKLLHLNQAPYVWQDKEIVDFSTLARIKLAVVDAIACLESDKSPIYDGGGYGIQHIVNRVKMNTIIAGYDPVAVDHVCARVIGLNPDDFEYITLAERTGLGTNNPDSIVVLGSTIDQMRRPFKKAQTWSALYGQGNRTWMLNGPFPTTGVDDPMNHEFLAGEADLSPTGGARGWSQPLYFTNDQVMLNDYFRTGGISTDNVVSYAFVYVTSPADQQAELWVGSDEALRVILNGQTVYNYTGARTFAGTECYKDTVTITLHKGVNRLLLKTLQTIGNYNFSVNICDIQPDPLFRGNRVWGLKFTTAPEVASAIDPRASSTFAGTVLLECYPNPFNPQMVVRYTVAPGAPGVLVELTIFDVLGHKVATLVDGVKSSGTHEVVWDASGQATGVYFCRLLVKPSDDWEHRAGQSVQTRKLLLLR